MSIVDEDRSGIDFGEIIKNSNYDLNKIEGEFWKHVKALGYCSIKVIEQFRYYHKDTLARCITALEEESDMWANMIEKLEDKNMKLHCGHNLPLCSVFFTGAYDSLYTDPIVNCEECAKVRYGYCEEYCVDRHRLAFFTHIEKKHDVEHAIIGCDKCKELALRELEGLRQLTITLKADYNKKEYVDTIKGKIDYDNFIDDPE